MAFIRIVVPMNAGPYLGRSNDSLTMVNIAVFAPMPSASARMAGGG